jgi:hypothetical protein
LSFTPSKSVVPTTSASCRSSVSTTATCT